MLPGMAVGTQAAMKNMDGKETYKTFLDNGRMIVVDACLVK